jgi:hypothetical protein
VIYSQPKLSYTHYPVLPSLDWTFRFPNQLNPDPLKPAPTTPHRRADHHAVTPFPLG